LPFECCGVLVGTPHAILEAVPSTNLADDRLRRFLLDPQVHIDARRRARRRGLAVVGFYHSHPHSAPQPSAADRDGATYRDCWYLIVRPLVDGCEMRLWALDGERFVEIELEGIASQRPNSAPP
jgi:proteasome lid subunit RPN8/RPN11